MIKHEVSVKVGSGTYPIYIGDDLFAQPPEGFSGGGQAILLTDQDVAPHYQEIVEGMLEKAGWSLLDTMIVKAGEETKSFASVEKLCSDILAHGIDRKTTLFALGGGVVGDLSGFLASILLRGISFVQIPTTLLAQVDSAVGGKTGINTAEGKNLVGAFYQPQSVLINTDSLKTLPERELKAGYAEVIKYGFIHDAGFWTWLQENGADVLSCKDEAIAYAVKRSCEIKAEVVSLDERETQDVRALLNFGHTFGHALEKIAGYDGRLKHGEGVAIGMLMAARLSEAIDLCAKGVADEVEEHLLKHGLPTKPSFSVAVDDMMHYMHYDKKMQNGKIRFVLLEKIGKACVVDDVSADIVKSVLQNSL